MPIVGAAALPLLGASGPGWFESLERSIMHFITCGLHNETLSRIFLSVQSDKQGIPLVLAVLALYGGFHPRRAWRGFLALGLAIGVGMLIAGLLWSVVERKRPPHHYEQHLTTPEEIATCAANPDALALHIRPSKRPSFPSRHGLTVGVIIASFFLLSRWLGLGALVYGTLVIVGRVYISKHWPSDMLAGAILGAVLAWLAWRHGPALLRRVGLVRLGHYVDTDRPEHVVPTDSGING